MAAQIVITVQLFLAIVLTLLKRSIQSFFLAYSGIVLLISYNLFLFRELSFDFYSLMRYGNILFSYLYFPVLLYSYLSCLNVGFRKSQLIHFIIPFVYTLLKLIFKFPHAYHVSFALPFFIYYLFLSFQTLKKLRLPKKTQEDKIWFFYSATVAHVLIDFSMLVWELNHGQDRLSQYPNNIIHFVSLYIYLFVFATYLLMDLPILRPYVNPIKSSPVTHSKDYKETVNKLKAIMQTNKPFLISNLKVEDLSKLVGVQKNTLTEILKKQFGMNFNVFVNTWRIEEFVKKANDADAAKYDIVGIAMECGFASKASFFRVFKQIKGTTPAEYLTRMNIN